MTAAISYHLDIERVFDAPRALVFGNWTEGEHLGAWFAPAGFEVVDSMVDRRVGGNWRVSYRSPSGDLYVERGEVLELVQPERLRLTLVNESGGRVAFKSEVTVAFSERDGKTTMVFRQTGLPSPELRDSLRGGWGSCLDKLTRQLAAEAEIRALFEEWFQASEQKDINASMAPIAHDVIAFEHSAPLLHRGVDALRAECKTGFDKAPLGFRWDVPDLHVIIRGDLAVTWGLNHMRGNGLDMWSRGTRVFQKIDGRWKMIHQHVSFPIDPSTGAARMDLHP